MTVLEVKIQHAGYEEAKHVIQNIHFVVKAGELIGLLGPNGSGKSTTVKAVLGLLKEMEGEILFFGAHQKMAYIPEQPVLYQELTLWEHLELAGAVYHLDSNELWIRGEMLLERYGMEKVRHHLPGSFSKGMQQKVMLILAFLIQPDVFVVDEPFVGLDPKATKIFLDMLAEEQQRGAGVLLSTHVLDTAEKICDSFLLVNEGQIIAKGDLSEIQKQCGLPDLSLFDCFHKLVE